ncbi:MAG: DNA-directed RNA polymerase subunit K [Candidatus Altiarchaeales archaeon]|nr:MAG: DNA-directed RNA polymerase subunit K [Candidatus Altiarchaeales archaeon]
MSYTKFEIARLLGARALQIKMGAPILIRIPKTVEKPLDIAKLELEKGVLPITVKKREVKRVRKKVKIIPEIPLEEKEEEKKEGIVEEGEELIEEME